MENPYVVNKDDGDIYGSATLVNTTGVGGGNGGDGDGGDGDVAKMCPVVRAAGGEAKAAGGEGGEAGGADAAAEDLYGQGVRPAAGHSCWRCMDLCLFAMRTAVLKRHSDFRFELPDHWDTRHGIDGATWFMDVNAKNDTKLDPRHMVRRPPLYIFIILPFSVWRGYSLSTCTLRN